MKANIFVVAGFGLLAATSVAQAQEAPNLVTKYGMSVGVGGGVLAFTDSTVNDFADPGGAWEARLALGTREYVAVEAAYIGSAQNIDAIGLDNDAVLLGNGFEASARVNALKGAWQPYALAGVAWRHYEITRADTNTSDILDNDDVLEVPLGAGLSYRYNQFVIDGRAVYRAAFDDELVQAAEPSNEANMHNFSANLLLGYEF